MAPTWVDGAVPSKTLLDESYFYRLLQQHELVEQRGVRLPPARLNMQAAQAALKGNIERLGKVYKSELSKYNVTVYKGTAAFKTPAPRPEIASARRGRSYCGGEVHHRGNGVCDRPVSRRRHRRDHGGLV